MTSGIRVRLGKLDTWPWFWHRPQATIVVSIALFAGIFVLRLMVGGPEDAVSMLFALPIALVAVAFGLRAGLLAGLAGTCLVAVWVLVDGVSLSPVGWASRVTPMLLLGCLLGQAVDRLRAAEDGQRALVLASRRQRDAIEINDTIVQGLSAAKWSLEAGNAPGALSIVEDTLRQSHELVSGLLRDADMGPVGKPRDAFTERSMETSGRSSGDPARGQERRWLSRATSAGRRERAGTSR